MGERFAPLLAERNEQIALITTIVATGVLCLGSFLALRLIVLRTVQDMLQQHERLESLLRVAQDLAESAHAQMVTENAACWAQRLTGAEASWVLIRETPDKPFTVDCQRGTQAAEWLEANQDEWMDLVERALETGEAFQIDAQRGADLSTAFLPLARSSEEGDHGVLVVASDTGAFTSMDLDALRTLAAQSGVALTNAERGDSQRNFLSGRSAAPNAHRPRAGTRVVQEGSGLRVHRSIPNRLPEPHLLSQERGILPPVRCGRTLVWESVQEAPIALTKAPKVVELSYDEPPCSFSISVRREIAAYFSSPPLPIQSSMILQT